MMNGKFTKKLMAFSVGALLALQGAAVSAADISPEAEVFIKTEVEEIACEQIGKNYVYIDITTANAANDDNVVVYLVDDADSVKSIGQDLIGLNAARVKLGVADSVPTGTYKAAVALQYSGVVKTMPVFFVGSGDVDGFFNAVNMPEGSELAAVRTEMDTYSHALSVISYEEKNADGDKVALKGDDYKALSDEQKDAFVSLVNSRINGDYSGETVYDAYNSEKFMKDAYMLAVYNESGSTEAELADALYRFGITDAEVKDKAMLVKIAKNMVPQALHVDNGESSLKETVEKAVAVELVNEGFWSNLVNIVEENNDIFGVSTSDIASLNRNKSLKDTFCKKFQGNSYMSVDDVKAAWDNAYEYAKDKSEKPSGGGGGGGTGSTKDDDDKVVNVTGTAIAGNTDVLGVKPVITDYYTDITKDYYWCADAVLNLTVNQVVSGYGDKTFGPSKNLTRAEFMKMLVNVCGLADVTATSTFTDVDKNAWYYVYVASAEKAGLATGYGNGLFGVNDAITREDALTLVYRAAKLKGISLNNFSVGILSNVDKDEISPYAVDAVKALYGAGVYFDTKDIDTMSLKYIEPKKKASRAYVALILDALYRLKK